jgi:Leucine-rich repeat (LRR) protein
VSLIYLYCSYTSITELPPLPVGLQNLYCAHTQIIDLPPLPAGLYTLVCNGCPLVLKRGQSESIAEYEARWIPYREEKASRLRFQERCRVVKEDLIAEVMHPRRIEKLLVEGGWEALEACF